MSVTASWISSGNSGNPAASAASARRTVDTVFTAVPCLLRGVLGRSPGDLPASRHQVRDRHPKFYEDRDNLSADAGHDAADGVRRLRDDATDAVRHQRTC